MNGGFRKGQVKWKIILETGLQRYLIVCSKNYRVRDRYYWRFLYPAGILSRVWYSIPLWIKLETEPPIMSSILDLAQDREVCRCHGRLSSPMYEKI